MRWFYNMKIGAKLITSFLLVALIAGLVGFVGVYNLNKTDKNYSELYTNFGIALGDIAEVSISYQRSRVALRELLLDKEVANRNNYEAKIDGYGKQIQEALTRFEQSLQT
ncbi:MAG: methyl-accepting chemotaxis sensory transducer, partial [Clostridia bacterium]|nr:methyl-accepting chemotaxis sensory transducer [Clostridia bacterium]